MLVSRYSLLIFLLILALFALVASLKPWKVEPIRVGVLHSQTGSLAFSERPVLQATLAAIQHINQQGGVLGRPLEAVIADGKSDDRQFEYEATRLIEQEKVSVIFGGWTSASRKAMLPVLEKHDGLLFYPVQYEGLEQSSHVVYMGSAPNQQIYPAVSWMMSHLGKKVLIVGSDYIFPRMASMVASPLIVSLSGEISGEFFVPLGVQDFEPLLTLIETTHPDVILNLVNGSSNIGLFNFLFEENIRIPVMSLSIAEPELRQLMTHVGTRATWEHYSVSDYFQSIESDKNREFVEMMQQFLGEDALVSSPMHAAWDGVHLWREAVQLSKISDANVINRNVSGLSVSSSTGIVSVDVENRHVWHSVFVGKVNPTGQFDVLWQSQLSVHPEPWPKGHSHQGWQNLVQIWRDIWGGRWQAN